VAGLLLTGGEDNLSWQVRRIFESASLKELAGGFHIPVMVSDLRTFQVTTSIANMRSSILPTSLRYGPGLQVSGFRVKECSSAAAGPLTSNAASALMALRFMGGRSSTHSSMFRV
jgi:hypothetical protein